MMVIGFPSNGLWDAAPSRYLSHLCCSLHERAKLEAVAMMPSLSQPEFEEDLLLPSQVGCCVLSAYLPL